MSKIQKIKKFLRHPKKIKKLIIYNLLGIPTIEAIIAIWTYFTKNKKHKLIQALKKGFQEHNSNFKFDDEVYETILNRICNSYIKAKNDQENVDKPYQVGDWYQKSIDTKFKPLTTALYERNLEELKRILENFQRSELVGGMGTSGDEYLKAKKNRIFKYRYINRWCNYYDKLKDITNGSPHFSYSFVGNPAGILIDGGVIHPESIRFHYTSLEICSLLKDVSKPVICEIGSGSGGQAYKIIDDFNEALTYVLLDIPEVLVFASYFLMTNFPSKKILLYGENNFNSDTINKYEIILQPNFMLLNFDSESVDLFFNDCSFSEMDSNAVKEYFRQIERICRKYFMHINHNAKFAWNYKGRQSQNLPATEIEPDPKQFKKIYQHYRVFRDRPERIFYKLMKAEHFEFLYEKCNRSY